MGTGKTTVGRICAQRLGRPFVDTDDLIEDSAGRSVGRIWSEDGEPAFRALEADAVARACGTAEPAVISCGGGAVLDPRNRQTIRACGYVAWLDAAPASIADRVGDERGRPLLGAAGDEAPVDVITRLASARQAAYADVADARIETDALAAEEVADVVLAAHLPGHLPGQLASGDPSWDEPGPSRTAS